MRANGPLHLPELAATGITEVPESPGNAVVGELERTGAAAVEHRGIPELEGVA
jgi:hypothetical protein